MRPSRAPAGPAQAELTDPPYRCPVCDSKVSDFLRLEDYYLEKLDEYGYVHSVFCEETLNLLHYRCPVCRSPDRSRLYALYLGPRLRELAAAGEGPEVLDVAPDPTLAAWIKGHRHVRYRSVDLIMEGADDRADVTDLALYADGRFHVILCSHVLEHVRDDRRALAELRRVLSPRGFAIVMAPILLTLEEDLEDPGISSEADRWKYYGRGDHLRFYSKKGFVGKLEGAGFKVEQLGMRHFGSTEFGKFGIHPRSVLYVARK